MNRPDTSTTVTPDDLRRLAALVEENELTELRYEQGEVRITLRTAAYFRERGTTVAAISSSSGIPLAEAPTPEEAYGDAEEELDAISSTPGTPIEAPVMGVFYRSASPGDPPFVEVGDTVEVGQPVGLIEAMKVFSEVKSEVSGIVREIVASDKALVQPGDTLLILNEQ